MEDDRLLVLSGPTAAGKTAIALSLARSFPLEIVNADSLQVYRGMDIGTAKPTAGERLEITHHLVDIADPDEEYNAGRFVDDAGSAIRGARERGKFPLITGGTGMYIRALLRGLDPLPSDHQVRARLNRLWEADGGAELFEELERTDPASAAAIHPRDRIRVLRALEVAAVSGTPASALKRRWASKGRKFRILFISLSLDREKLYRRINDRVDRMFSAGLIEEVQGLLDAGYGPELKPMKALGYRHVVSHLLSSIPIGDAVEQMKRDTRRYAKRQITWLSREPDAIHLDAERAEEKAKDLAVNYLY